MRKLLYLLIVSSFIVGCEVNEERLDLLEQDVNRADPFYRFDDNQSETLSVSEGGNVTVRVEAPVKISGANQEVIVVISASGLNSADLAELSFTNVTEVGDGPEGNINSIEYSNGILTGTIQNRDTLVSLPLDIQISVPTDGVTDGDKELILNLDTAYIQGASEDLLNVGEISGNLRSKTIRVVDIDCPSDLSGTYDGVNCFPDPANPSVWTEDPDTNGLYTLTDFTGGYYGFAGAPNIPLTLNDGCGNLSAEPFSVFNGALQFENINGTVNEDGTIELLWTESTGFATGGAPTQCSTTFTPN